MENMSMQQIESLYPNQWVGLTNVKWADDTNISSAVVRYIGKTADELGMMQIKQPDLYSIYTTPDQVEQLGFVGCSS